jgi:hypothetical protein
LTELLQVLIMLGQLVVASKRADNKCPALCQRARVAAQLAHAADRFLDVVLACVDSSTQVNSAQQN